MSKALPLSELDIIDIYNLVNTKINDDKVLHRTYGLEQNSALMKFIEQNIGKIPETKPVKSNKKTITNEQAFSTVLSMIEDVAKKN